MDICRSQARSLIDGILGFEFFMVQHVAVLMATLVTALESGLHPMGTIF